MPEHSSDLNAQLLAACETPPADPAALTALLAQGADPDASARGGNPLYWDTFSPLHLLSLSRDNPVEAGAVLLRAGADPGLQSEKRRWTPLHIAAGVNHTALVSLLLRHGVDPDQVAYRYRSPTPLIACINFNVPLCLPTVEVLLTAGADPNLRHPEGEGPLHAAVEARNLPVIERLLAAGADPNLPRGDGDTPLMRAVRRAESMPVIETLLAHGARVDAQNHFQRRAIHHAALDNNVDYVHRLCAAGADVNAIDKDEETAILAWLSWKARPTPPEIIAALIANGADVNLANKDGMSALHLAIEKGEREIVQSLIAAGADPTALDPDGRSAFARAEQDNPLLLSVLGSRQAIEAPAPSEGVLWMLKTGRRLLFGEEELGWQGEAWRWRRGARRWDWSEEAVRELIVYLLLHDATEGQRLVDWMSEPADAPAWASRSVAALQAALSETEPERVARCQLSLEPHHGPAIIEAAVRAGYQPVRHDKEGFWVWRFQPDHPEATAFHFSEAGDHRPEKQELDTDAAALRRFFDVFKVENGRLVGFYRNRLNAALETLGCATERVWLSTQAERDEDGSARTGPKAHPTPR